MKILKTLYECMAIIGLALAIIGIFLAFSVDMVTSSGYFALTMSLASITILIYIIFSFKNAFKKIDIFNRTSIKAHQCTVFGVATLITTMSYNNSKDITTALLFTGIVFACITMIQIFLSRMIKLLNENLKEKTINE